MMMMMIYIYIYVIRVLVVTKSLCEYVSNQVHYMESAIPNALRSWPDLTS